MTANHAASPRVCVVGAGAIGGLVAARLIAADQRVSVLETGPRLEAIERDGISLIDAPGAAPLTVRPEQVSDRAASLGAHDIVLLALKSHDIASVAASLPSLYHDTTVVVTLQNGIPWWYFQRHGGGWDGRRLATLDPDGIIERNVPIERILGGIAYPAAEVQPDGVIRLVEGNRFSFGEPSGEVTPRLEALVALFQQAGFKSFALDDVRGELWLKAWGALAFNPLSALSHATMAELCRFGPTRALVEGMMTEAEQLARVLGITFRVPLERRIAGAEAVGHHKTSMLQDLEAGRQMELDAIILVLEELALMAEVPVPLIAAVSAIVQMRSLTADVGTVASAPSRP